MLELKQKTTLQPLPDRVTTWRGGQLSFQGLFTPPGVVGRCGANRTSEESIVSAAPARRAAACWLPLSLAPVPTAF